MAWKGENHPVPPEFNQLIAILENARIHQSNPALWQVINQLIQRSKQDQDYDVKQFVTIIGQLTDNSTDITNVVTNLKDATFWTRANEQLNFPSSYQVIAGLGIILDYSVAGQVTISVDTTFSFSLVPMTTGAEPLEIMSNGAGEVLLIPYDNGPV